MKLNNAPTLYMLRTWSNKTAIGKWSASYPADSDAIGLKIIFVERNLHIRPAVIPTSGIRKNAVSAERRR
jgi:hypothetical protein